MNVVINGEKNQIPEGLTLADLLNYLQLRPERVAVEYNREVLARERWAERKIREGDSLEIVHLVGGG